MSIYHFVINYDKTNMGTYHCQSEFFFICIIYYRMKISRKDLKCCYSKDLHIIVLVLANHLNFWLNKVLQKIANHTTSSLQTFLFQFFRILEANESCQWTVIPLPIMYPNCRLMLGIMYICVYVIGCSPHIRPFVIVDSNHCFVHLS